MARASAVILPRRRHTATRAGFGAAALVAAGALAVVPDGLLAQGPPPPPRDPAYDLRADLLAAREATLHAGAGVLWPVGRAVRLGVQAGAGATWLDEGSDGPAGADGAGGDRTVASGRVELVARFELDPFAERRWGLYGQAGGGLLAVRGRPGRAVVLAVFGIERRTDAPLAPALEIGLGGGVRVGLAFRAR